MNDHQVAISANGKNVYINLMSTPASDAISRNPNLLSLLKEILSGCKLEGPAVKLETDMKRTVGYLDSILTKDDDAVFYARQAKSDVFTRFVKNRKTDATSIVSVNLKQTGPKSYFVNDVRIGSTPIPLPGTPEETKHSYAYWTTHAVVYNGQPLLASSVTKDCPYPNPNPAVVAAPAVPVA